MPCNLNDIAYLYFCNIISSYYMNYFYTYKSNSTNTTTHFEERRQSVLTEVGKVAHNYVVAFSVSFFKFSN